MMLLERVNFMNNRLEMITVGLFWAYRTQRAKRPKGGSKMNKIINRLMRELPDGSVEVAGYSIWHKGLTYHFRESDMWSVENRLGERIKENSLTPTACDIDCENDDAVDMYYFNTHFIPHTRLDRWTGLKYQGGRLMFERDIIDEVGNTRIVKWHFNRWVLFAKAGGGGKPNISELRKIDLRRNFIKFLSIEGVKEAT
jgi:hypothetical protein